MDERTTLVVCEGDETGQELLEQALRVLDPRVIGISVDIQRFDLSLGMGLGKVKGRMFRIGHLGDSNDLTLLAALAGCEMGMRLATGLPYESFVFLLESLSRGEDEVSQDGA